MDDCGPTSLAMAVGWATQYELFPTAQEGWEMAEKAGRADRPDKPDPTTFKQLIKAAKKFGMATEYVRSCPDMTKKAKAGAAIILNIQASEVSIPARAISKWQKRTFKAQPKNFSYGHYVVLAWVDGWYYACPTMNEKKEQAVKLSQAEVDILALSKAVFPPPAIAVTKRKA